jgi:hypothetical protein
MVGAASVVVTGVVTVVVTGAAAGTAAGATVGVTVTSGLIGMVCVMTCDPVMGTEPVTTGLITIVDVMAWSWVIGAAPVILSAVIAVSVSVAVAVELTGVACCAGGAPATLPVEPRNAQSTSAKPAAKATDSKIGWKAVSRFESLGCVFLLEMALLIVRMPPHTNVYH